MIADAMFALLVGIMHLQTTDMVLHIYPLYKLDMMQNKMDIACAFNVVNDVRNAHINHDHNVVFLCKDVLEWHSMICSMLTVD